MPVSVVFRCEVCARRPGPETQASLERQLLDLMETRRPRLRAMPAPDRRPHLDRALAEHLGGVPLADWHAVVAEARAGEERGDWRVTGVWSHFACSDEPDHPANAAQRKAFDEACALAEDAGGSAAELLVEVLALRHLEPVTRSRLLPTP